MFAYQDVIDSVKGLANSDKVRKASHCKLLEFYSKQLGFQSYNHLKDSLAGMPSEQLLNVSLKLMRNICSIRTPSIDSSYYEFWAFDNDEIGYYSSWIGWDSNGREVRAPRALVAKPTATQLRQLYEHPIYVVESDKEIICWRHKWKGTALIPEALAKDFFKWSFNKRIKVSKNPPMDLVRKHANEYIHNMMFE
ncbi:hypothetical protein [Rheinheimera sp. MM224]|uniref:hypothetical protein n=1 Tax=Rheinheimera sp. MM224 TaxID=3019969 RepID=UPI0021F8480E|nr:hypothetical protein [Rheinheimera sp. MM224]CAI3804205.1 hypothetical protein JAMGFMIE_03560 [Rheinheimera sp. MM224]